MNVKSFRKEFTDMTLSNTKLIQMIQTLGEEKVTRLLSKKIEDDDYRKEYHAKYNAKRNEIMKTVRGTHPELFKVKNA